MVSVLCSILRRYSYFVKLYERMRKGKKPKNNKLLANLPVPLFVQVERDDEHENGRSVWPVPFEEDYNEWSTRGTLATFRPVVSYSIMP